MARSSATWKPGIPSPNPTGKATLAERVAARTIAESFRELADPVDIGRSLLAIYAGVDPFAKKGDAEPGGPSFQPVPLDMTHRMAALKMYLEYGYGKPLQGVVIDAQVRQQTTIREERTAVVELRELGARDPQVKAALGQIARAMLGAGSLPAEVVAPETPSSARVLDQAPALSHEVVPARGALAGAPLEVGELEAVAVGDESDGRVVLELGDGGEADADVGGHVLEEDGVVVGGGDQGVELGDLHEKMLAQLDEVVNDEEKKSAGVRHPGMTL